MVELDIPGTIRRAREKLGMRPATLAAMVEVDRAAVLRWERGEREPSASNLLCLAHVLDLEFADFWEE